MRAVATTHCRRRRSCRRANEVLAPLLGRARLAIGLLAGSLFAVTQ